MANPQPDKHTRISNELAEAFARHHFSGNEWKVLWVILRNTYGWNRKKHALSFSFIAKATGILESNVAHIIRSLLLKNTIGVVKNNNTDTNIYYLNKDYEQWRGIVKTNKGVVKTNTARRVKINNQQRKTLKKEYIYAHFKEFYDLYPRKVKRPEAQRSYKKVTKKEHALILEDVKRRLDGEWREIDKQFIPYPASYINGRRWEDEVEEDNLEKIFK